MRSNQEEQKITIYVANRVNAAKWKKAEYTWPELVTQLTTSEDTGETYEEYRKMSEKERGERKDVGGFVGGILKDGSRAKKNIIGRTLISLDLDYGNDESLGEVEAALPYAWCYYSTHSHTPSQQRFRIIIPLTRMVTPEEYEAVSRKLVSTLLDIEQFDKVSFSCNQLMYWPSHPTDITPEVGVWSGEFCDPDYWLAQYNDWHDMTEWAYSSRQKKQVKHLAQRQVDPCSKQGIVGTFCRMYNIHEVIQKYMPDYYLPTKSADRYTFAGSKSLAGVVVYEDGKFLYSHHETDPLSGRALNSWDLLRLYLYGEMDGDTEQEGADAPSYQALKEKLSSDPEFRKFADSELMADFQKIEDEPEEANAEDEGNEWMSKLLRNKDGITIKNELTNVMLILQHDPKLQSIRKNDLSGLIEANIKGMPWYRQFTSWTETDDSCLITYLNKKYKVHFADNKFRRALDSVAQKRHYNPITEYLDTLPEWDGEERVDELLIKYLGAPDNIYVREATRKFLVAAISRAYHPGCKFDDMIVLSGDQGIGKSTLCAKLGGKWFSDSVSLGDAKELKMIAEQLQESWIVEFAELKGMRTSQAETIRAFLSRQNDRYRPSYGRYVEDHPRHCVFFGTTNDNDYLTDVTGNRRFWPIAVDGAKRTANAWDIKDDDIDQIWAEAKVRYEAGEELTITDEQSLDLVNQARMAALEVDSKRDRVMHFLDIGLPPKEEWDYADLAERRTYIRTEGRDTSIFSSGHNDRRRDIVSSMEIWTEGLDLDLNKMNRTDTTNLGRLMSTLPEWIAVRHRLGNTKYTLYVRAESGIDPQDKDTVFGNWSPLLETWPSALPKGVSGSLSLRENESGKEMKKDDARSFFDPIDDTDFDTEGDDDYLN